MESGTAKKKCWVIDYKFRLMQKDEINEELKRKHSTQQGWETAAFWSRLRRLSPSSHGKRKKAFSNLYSTFCYLLIILVLFMYHFFRLHALKVGGKQVYDIDDIPLSLRLQLSIFWRHPLTKQKQLQVEQHDCALSGHFSLRRNGISVALLIGLPSKLIYHQVFRGTSLLRMRKGIWQTRSPGLWCQFPWHKVVTVLPRRH